MKRSQMGCVRRALNHRLKMERVRAYMADVMCPYVDPKSIVTAYAIESKYRAVQPDPNPSRNLVHEGRG